MEAIKFIEKEIEYLKIKNKRARLKSFTEERIAAFENVLLNLRKGKTLIYKSLDKLEIEITTRDKYLKDAPKRIPNEEIILAIEQKIKLKQETFYGDHIKIFLPFVTIYPDQVYFIKTQYVNNSEFTGQKWHEIRIEIVNYSLTQEEGTKIFLYF